MKTIILRLDNNAIHFNSELQLSYDQSNLHKEHFRLVKERLVYLEAEMVHFIKESGTLRVKVVDYSSSKHTDFLQQQPKDQIRRIEFEKMDWEKFSSLVYSYTLSRELDENFFNVREPFWALRKSEDKEDAKQKDRWDMEQLRRKAPNLFFQGPRTPVVENIQTVVKVKFEEATFGDGQISFMAKLKDYHIIHQFTILNLNLKKEFENIKPWFVKKIGKSFIVSVTLKLVDGRVEEATATSEDISSINEEMIESIKTQRVLMLVKAARKKDNEQVVFDNDEIFGVLDEADTGSNVFNSSADNILEILIVNGLAKNIKQLEFLSRDKQSLNEKLRFTLKPHFGFLFKVETSLKQFFIWELLNSHATYVWENERTDLNFYQTVEEEIAFIRANGREEYRRHYKSLLNKTFKFQIIEHDNADLTEEERFHSWKRKLEAMMLEFV